MSEVKILSLKNTWSRKPDWILVKNAAIQPFKVFSKLIQKNLLLIVVLIAVEVSYFYFLFPDEELNQMKKVHELFQTIALFAFSTLKWAFLIFLVPFQLYNWNIQASSSSKPLLQFKPFLSRSIWPVIVDPIKGLFFVTVYMFFGLVFCIVLGFISYFGSKYIGISISSIPSFLQNLLLSSLIFIAFLPAVIKTVQFFFIPMVIFFNKEYIENKKSSLKLSIQASHGLSIALIALWLAYSLISYFIVWGIRSFFSDQGGIFSSFSPLFYTSNSLFNVISIIYISAVFYFIYAEKDKNHII